MEYHKKTYSANLMNLAVLGKQNLDELQKMVETMFSDVPNKDIPLPKWLESPYSPTELQSWAKLVPVKDLRQLQVMFPIPDTTEFFKTGVRT
jgi:insulysin